MKYVISTLVILIMLTTSCSMMKNDLEKAGGIVLKNYHPESLSLDTNVYSTEDGMMVVGRLARATISPVRIPGHIDIKVSDPSGEEIYSLTANFRKLPSRRHGANPLAFSATFPELPPSGSIVEVRYDVEPHQ